MARQRGGNRTVFISIFVGILIAGIVVGVLFATGVLGKKSGSSSGGGSKSLPIIPGTPGSKHNIPGSASNEPEIITVFQIPSATPTVVRLQVEFNYLTNVQLNTVTANIVTSFSGSGTKTLTAKGINILEGGAPKYMSEFDIDLSSIPPWTPPGSPTHDANMTITINGVTSSPYSFNFDY